MTAIIVSYLGSLTYVQVERHYSKYAVPELSLEKLQIICTSVASPPHKVKWLKWMNASDETREARRFPPRPVNQDKLQSFLARACFYAGVSIVWLFILQIIS